MRKRHEIEVPTEPLVFSHTYASSKGGKADKDFRVAVNGFDVCYEVVSHRKVVLTTKSIEVAVKEYNELD